MLTEILKLYDKYAADLRYVREKQKMFTYGDKKLVYRKYDDLEAELLYMLVKEYKPSVIKELGCAGGWSLTWMLQACKENGKGSFIDSFDPACHRQPYKNDLEKVKALDQTMNPVNIWKCHKMKAQEACKYGRLDIPNIDFLFIDAEHSLRFHRWCIDKVIEPIRQSGRRVPVIIHDVFYTRKGKGVNAGPTIGSVSYSPECIELKAYLKEHNIKIWSISSGFRDVQNAIKKKRKILNIGQEGNFIKNAEKNPSLIFFLNDNSKGWKETDD